MVSPHPKNKFPDATRGSPVQSKHQQPQQHPKSSSNRKPKPQRALFPSGHGHHPQQQYNNFPPIQHSKSSSPNSSAKSYQPHSKTPKLATRAHSLPCSPAGGHHQNRNLSRHSMTPSPKMYASSKCFEPPTPKSLPKPPMAWTGSEMITAAASQAQSYRPQPASPVVQDQAQQSASLQYGMDVTQHLKMILKLQA